LAQDLPYTVVYGKFPELFKKISDAKVPDLFSHAFLRDTLGFKSNNDRTLISVLKHLGMIDSSGKPTSRYRELKNSSSKGAAVAAGIKDAYALLYDANEKAHDAQGDELKGLIAQVAGTDKDMTGRIYYTLSALIKEADFSAPADTSKEERDVSKPEDAASEKVTPGQSNFKALNSQFHYNIQIHLPNNGTEETYLNIFNAIRETFG